MSRKFAVCSISGTPSVPSLRAAAVKADHFIMTMGFSFIVVSASLPLTKDKEHGGKEKTYMGLCIERAVTLSLFGNGRGTTIVLHHLLEERKSTSVPDMPAFSGRAVGSCVQGLSMAIVLGRERIDNWQCDYKVWVIAVNWNLQVYK